MKRPRRSSSGSSSGSAFLLLLGALLVLSLSGRQPCCTAGEQVAASTPQQHHEQDGDEESVADSAPAYDGEGTTAGRGGDDVEAAAPSNSSSGGSGGAMPPAEVHRNGEGHLVLSQKLMRLSKVAARLSALAYEEDPAIHAVLHHGEGDGNGTTLLKFEQFGFYDEEPDQAIVAKTTYGGYCYAAFRGTTLTIDDWQQNVIPGNHEVCYTDSSAGGGGGGVSKCCTTRLGFYQAYDTTYRAAMEEELRKCAKTCDNKDECVVLTGHSQGGAVAAVAGVALADLNPYVITFGQPPTILAPCPIVTSERWYRYVNTKQTQMGNVGITYDPVPFLPGLGADAFGHMMILSGDVTSVAYIGLDTKRFFGPLNTVGFEAHFIVSKDGGKNPGYFDRIEAVMSEYENGTYPVRITGYTAGSLCTQNIECASGRCGRETALSYSRCIGTYCATNDDCDTACCDSGVCLEKLDSCMACDEDTDCLYGKCSFFRCSGEGGLMDNNCVCAFDSDCRSGRCEGLPPRECEAQLGVGAFCNEDSDCLSSYCSWFRCRERSSWWRSPTTSDAAGALKDFNKASSGSQEEEKMDNRGRNNETNITAAAAGPSGNDAATGNGNNEEDEEEDTVEPTNPDENVVLSRDIELPATTSESSESASSRNVSTNDTTDDEKPNNTKKKKKKSGHRAKRKKRIILTSFVGGLLLLVIGYYAYYDRKKREGYEEVPTSLIV